MVAKTTNNNSVPLQVQKADENNLECEAITEDEKAPRTLFEIITNRIHKRKKEKEDFEAIEEDADEEEFIS